MNTQSKGTPGEWKLSHQTGNGFTVAHEIAPSNGNLLVIATCSTQKKYLGHEITEDDARQNARIIATAPAGVELAWMVEALWVGTANPMLVTSGLLDLARSILAGVESEK